MGHAILNEILVAINHITVANIKLLLFEADALEVGVLVEVFNALFELVYHEVLLILLIYAQ